MFKFGFRAEDVLLCLCFKIMETLTMSVSSASKGYILPLQEPSPSFISGPRSRNVEDQSCDRLIPSVFKMEFGPFYVLLCLCLTIKKRQGRFVPSCTLSRIYLMYIRAALRTPSPWCIWNSNASISCLKAHARDFTFLFLFSLAPKVRSEKSCCSLPLSQR